MGRRQKPVGRNGKYLALVIGVIKTHCGIDHRQPGADNKNIVGVFYRLADARIPGSPKYFGADKKA